MENLTNKEKEMFSKWRKIYAQDKEKYNNKVNDYFVAKKEIQAFLDGKNEKEDKKD